MTEGNRNDSKAVYRFIRDHGPVGIVDVARECFPLRFGTADPLYPYLIRRSVGRALASIAWLRRSGVAITCLSRPGYGSTFVLGDVRQGPEAVGILLNPVFRKSLTTGTSEASGVGDLMGLWHGDA